MSIKATVAAATHYTFVQGSPDYLVVSGPLGAARCVEGGQWEPFEVVHWEDTPCIELGLMPPVPMQALFSWLLDYSSLDSHGRRCKVWHLPIDCPDGEDWGYRKTVEYPDGATYNAGYRADGTWVDGWWD